MKTIFVTLLLSATVFTGFAQTQHVRSYDRSNGTHVQQYEKTTPNNTNRDNYSTTGNTNPNTGTYGTRAQDNTPAANNYGQGKEIKTGPRGGQYYENDNGTKTYVPKRSDK